MRRAAPLLIVLSLTACGGDDDDTAAPTTVEATTATTPTAPRETTTTSTTVVQSPADLTPPADAATAAATLARVERELRSDTRDAARVPALGWEQDLAYATLAAQPEWLAAVLDALPDDLREIAAANVGAAAQLSELSEPRAEFPPWTIRAPRPRDELLGYYAEAQAASGVAWQYLAAIHLVETRMGRIVGPSTAGAQGPMQFMPATWDAYGEGDVYDDRDAILAAGRYLDAAGAPDDMDAALYAYNHSDRYVAAIQAYAGLITADARAYDGYYHWQVHYGTTTGRYLLPEGYPSAADAVLL